MQLNTNTTESYDVKRPDKLSTLRSSPLGKEHWWPHCTHTVPPVWGKHIFIGFVKFVQEQGCIFEVIGQLLFETL